MSTADATREHLDEFVSMQQRLAELREATGLLIFSHEGVYLWPEAFVQLFPDHETQVELDGAGKRLLCHSASYRGVKFFAVERPPHDEP